MLCQIPFENGWLWLTWTSCVTAEVAFLRSRSTGAIFQAARMRQS